MTKPDASDRKILESIYRYCCQIERYIERFGDHFSVFSEDFAFYEGVTMNMMQIGEKAGRLSEAYREETKRKIPWQQIRGMRNLLAHNYDNLDVTRIWETVQEDIPVIRAFCAEQLAQTEPQMPTEENKTKNRCSLSCGSSTVHCICFVLFYFSSCSLPMISRSSAAVSSGGQVC